MVAMRMGEYPRGYDDFPVGILIQYPVELIRLRIIFLRPSAVDQQKTAVGQTENIAHSLPYFLCNQLYLNQKRIGGSVITVFLRFAGQHAFILHSYAQAGVVGRVGNVDQTLVRKVHGKPIVSDLVVGIFFIACLLQLFQVGCIILAFQSGVKMGFAVSAAKPPFVGSAFVCAEIESVLVLPSRGNSRQRNQRRYAQYPDCRR